MGRVGRLAQFFDVQLERTFRQFGLTRAGFDVLGALRRSGPPYRLPQKDLMTALLRTSGTTSFRIDRLEWRGLVRRKPNPADHRGVFVELTKQGRLLVDDAAPAHLANEERLLTTLTRGEQETLARLLRKLLVGFEGSSNSEGDN